MPIRLHLFRGAPLVLRVLSLLLLWSGTAHATTCAALARMAPAPPDDATAWASSIWQSVADARLVDPARQRAADREALAECLKPVLQAAKKATKAGDRAAALKLWPEAFALYPLGKLQLEATGAALVTGAVGLTLSAPA